MLLRFLLLTDFRRPVFGARAGCFVHHRPADSYFGQLGLLRNLTEQVVWGDRRRVPPAVELFFGQAKLINGRARLLPSPSAGEAVLINNR
jgi:hypothetical protein